MLWFLIALIVTIFLIVYWIRDGLSLGEIVCCGFLTLLISIGIALMLAILSSAIAEDCAAKTYYAVEDTDIYAMQDNVTAEGNCFLGSGHIDGELNYFYVAKTPFGYTVENVDAVQTYIQYTSDRCHIERQSYTFDNWFVAAIAIPMTDRYVIYIPEGSIVYNYAIDLQ